MRSTQGIREQQASHAFLQSQRWCANSPVTTEGQTLSYSSVLEGYMEATHLSLSGGFCERLDGCCRLPGSWHGAMLSHEKQDGLGECSP